MCYQTSHSRFVDIGAPPRIWAISSIHGDLRKLTALHDALAQHFQFRDKIVYLGNYTGYGGQSSACIDEILTFRRHILSIPNVRPSDLIYLRGAQEEMWQKLLQIQFAPSPTDTLLWMLGNGLAATLESYGISAHDGINACRYGVMGLTKWTNSVRSAIKGKAGHDIFGMHLTRAAHTGKDNQYPMLFVNAGLDFSKPLDKQGDSFWWAADNFENLTHAYHPFEKVVRGYDPKHKGVKLNCITATLDGGCGFGGDLVCAGFENDGTLFHVIDA